MLIPRSNRLQQQKLIKQKKQKLALDVEAMKNHFHKINHQRKMVKAAVKIQTLFRGFKARKFYSSYLQNKIRLAVKVQIVWKRHYASILEKRRQQQEYIDKVTFIQACVRGFLIRKNIRQNLIDKLNNIQEYFDDMKEFVDNDSAITIQRAWRRAIIRIRRFKVIKAILDNKKLVRIMAKWQKTNKFLKKRGKKRVNHHAGQSPNQNISSISRERKSVVSDTLLTKTKKPKPNAVTGKGQSNFNMTVPNLKLGVCKRNLLSNAADTNHDQPKHNSKVIPEEKNGIL